MSYYDLLFIRVGQLTVCILLVVGLFTIAKICYDHVIDWYEREFRLPNRKEVYDWQSFGEPKTYAGKISQLRKSTHEV